MDEALQQACALEDGAGVGRGTSSPLLAEGEPIPDGSPLAHDTTPDAGHPENCAGVAPRQAPSQLPPAAVTDAFTSGEQISTGGVVSGCGQSASCSDHPHASSPAGEVSRSGSPHRRRREARVVVDQSETVPVPWAITSSSGSSVDYSTSMRLGFASSTREEVLLAECHIRAKLEVDEEARERRWHELCKGVPLLVGAAPSTVESLRHLARQARQGGIPRSLRAVMWLTLTGMAQKLDENEYFCAWLLRRNGYVVGRHAQAIAADLERTFPGHPYFSDKDVGLYKLRNVLHALCWRNPLLNYCQSFNYLAAFLLLVLDDEERVFWMLTHILETLLPNDYFAENLLGTRVDQAVFEVLVAAKLPRLATALSAMTHFDISAVLPPWIMSLYINTLPPETTLRVWDYMFTASRVPTERTSAHLEVALAILKLEEKALLACEDAGSVMEHLRDAAAAMFDADVLIATARDLAIEPVQLHALRRRLKPLVALDIKQHEEQREARLAERVAQDEVRRRERERQSQRHADAECGSAYGGG